MTISNFFTKNLLVDDLVAAPMAGISHIPFRRILRKYFKGLIYSEMMSVEGIMRKNAESMEYLNRHLSETSLVFQLFGGNPTSFGEAVKVIEENVQVDAFDINMGCPVKKVLKAGGGCALLKDLPRLKEVVRTMRKSTSLPFSIKIRIGLDENHMVYKDVLDIAQSEGVDALIVHARTKAQMFGGTPRLDILAEMVSKATIPIIGNGGVENKTDYAAMKSTGVSGVMLGRSMMKSPWVFAAIRSGQEINNFITPTEIGNLLNEMWVYMLEHAAGRANKRVHYMHILRKFAVWYSKGLDNAVDFRVKVYRANSEGDIQSVINNFFQQYNQFLILPH